MKRRTVLLLLTAAILLTLLTGCGKSSTEVPEVYLDQAVQEFMEDEYLHWTVASDKYTDFSYVAFHSPDKRMHTDSVHFIVTVSLPFGTHEFTSDQVYRYSKSDDYWTETNAWEWMFSREYIDNDSLIGYTIVGSLDSGRSDYAVEIDSLDYDAGTITFSYLIRDYENSLEFDNSETLYLVADPIFSEGRKYLPIVNEGIEYTLSVSPVYGVKIQRGRTGYYA